MRPRTAFVCLVALFSTSLVLLPAVTTPAAAATAAITVGKTAPASALIGGDIPYTLSASNAEGNPAVYNISFRDVLPLGVTYVPGSSAPSGIGEPTTVGDGMATAQTLIWSDTFDLLSGTSNSISFHAKPDPDSYPVARALDNLATGYASSDPRDVPKFDSDGNPTADAQVVSAASPTAVTKISALDVTKSEPSPEHDVLRGVHDDPITYSLDVTNNPTNATNAVSVTDFLPAEFEFLGCGGIDNTPDGAVEYPGAPQLNATTPDAGCVAPDSVDTVSDPSGYPAGIYTKVVWSVGNLAPGQTATLTYQAGIPLRGNVLFPDGTATTGVQMANLSNNTGAPTRQIGAASTSTNHVQAAGDYQGAVFSGTQHVTADGSLDVTVNDVRIHKSVSPTSFSSGDIVQYTLTIDAGEYEDADTVTVTDTIPNGVCPLGGQNWVTGAPSDCDPVTGHDPSVAYDSVTQNDDGTFTIVFTPIPALTANGTVQVTYYGRMRTTYTGGPSEGEPTSSGDAFTNKAEQVSNTTPISPNDVDTAQQSVTDPTSATQTTDAPQLDKQIGERQTPMDCANATYADGLGSPVPPELTFAQGDRVCFRVTVDMASTSDARNPVLTDFLPVGTAYEAASMTAGPDNTVPLDELGFDESAATSGGILTWTLGHTTGQDQKEVTKGSVFQADFSVLVTGVAAGPEPDKVGNLAKYRQENIGGDALSLRDEVNFAIAPAPVTIVKGVASVGSTTYDPAADGKPAEEGDQVTYDIDVSNTSNATTAPPAQAMTDVHVWDVLPPGLDCGTVSAPIADGGTCTDPGQPGHPEFTGTATRSAIVWTTGVTIVPGGTHTYSYTLIVPSGTSVGTTLVNNSYVRSYDLSTDGGSTTQTHYPANNIDTSLPGNTVFDPQTATDPSSIVVPPVAVAKSVSSAISETNNAGNETLPNRTTVAVPGEQLTYTVTAKVPAHTTVFDATFTDPLPAGQTLLSASADFAQDAENPAYTTLPSGVTFDSSTTLSFGASYDNTTTTDQLFRMTINVRVDAADLSDNANGTARINTATFASSADPDGGPKPADVSSSATTTVAEPSPTLTKSNDKPSPVTVVEGSTVTYTLLAGNTAGRPPLHDAWVVDCLPGALSFSSFATIPADTEASTHAGTSASTTSKACATGTTEIDWNVHDLEPGATQTLTYTATVNPGAAGGVAYKNLAAITGTSLSGTRSVPTDLGNPSARTYTTATNSSVKVTSATITKTAAPTTPTVGDAVSYTVTVVLPQNVTFYNLAVIDTLPTGIVAPTTPPPATVSCVYSGGSACPINSATPLAGSGTKVGWLLGDAASSGLQRTVTLQYVAKVADVAQAAAGARLQNSALVAWDQTSKAPPSSAGASFDTTGGTPGKATVTVQEPSLTIVKSVDDAHPAPGGTFNYTIAATNSSAPNVSAAYNLTVSDLVPAGVVVATGSISDGGTISGADPTTGAGTITWAIPGPLAPSATKKLTYSASLAPSAMLTAAGLTNTATLTGYDSLPTGGRHYSPGSRSNATVTPMFPALTATKAATDGSLTYLGSHYRWTFTISNAVGAAKAYAVGGVDTLPANWTFDTGSATVAVNGGAPSATAPAVLANGGLQTLTFSGLGELGAGQSLTVTYTATPGPSVPTLPGIGHSVGQTNHVTATGTDATGASGNGSGSYSGAPATATTHIDKADVTLSKQVGTAPVAGLAGSWAITVHDNGPDPAVGPFTVTDDFDDALPTGLTAVSASGTGWTCSTGPITCTRNDTLASGASFPPISVGYTVAPDVSDGTVLTNSATVDERTYDPDSSNNTDGATTNVITGADLGIVKRLTSGAIVPGRSVTYALAVTNYGPSVSRGPISVTDTLPSGSTFISADGGAEWSCPSTATAGAITCTHGDLAPGASVQEISVTVAIPSSQTGTVTNSASVTATTPQNPDVQPNTAVVNTTPGPSADLEISKVLADPPLVAGDTARYTITVVNHGPSDAENVEVTDTLPSQLTYDSVTSATDWDCSHSGQDVTCDLRAGTLATEESASLTLVVRVGQFTEPIDNSARVHSSTSDPDPDNNESTSSGGVTSRADLSIAKSHRGAAVAGQNVTFDLAVTNHGPSDEIGQVTVTDVLQTHLQFASATGTGWTCAYDAPSRTVTCDGATGLQTGQEADPIAVTVAIDPSAGPGTIDNAATVAGTTDSPDPDPTNNSSTDTITVGVQSNVTLTKTLDTGTPVLAGDDATFTLTAADNGPSDASEVVVSDTLPQYLSFGSASGTGWTCDHTGPLVTCTRARLAANDSAAITLVAHTDPATPDPTTVENVATISTASPGTSTQPDPVPVPITRSADLRLTKASEHATVDAGSNVTWNLSVSNSGPSDADVPMTVVDTLPVYESYVSSDGAGWSCTAVQQTVTCTRADPLAAGDTDDALHLTATVDPSAPLQDEQNSATVSSPTTDSAPGNNTGIATVTVTGAADLSIVKSHSGAASIGGQLAFSLAVHNAGPSTADQVVVMDSLPDGLSYVSASGTGWVCAAPAAVVTCDLSGTLQPGDDAPEIAVVTAVHAAAYPAVANTATVWSDDPGLSGTDSSTDRVPVPPLAQLAINKLPVGTFTVGKQAKYELTVRNNGPTPNPGPVVVTDPLPDGLSYVTATGQGWACSAAHGVVTCRDVDGLALHESSGITLVVTVGAAAYPRVMNVATAAGPGSTPTTGTSTTSVAAQSRIRVVKTLLGVSNDTASYAIAMTNDGPNPTDRSAYLMDDLPAGLAFIDARGAGWACSQARSAVTCVHAASIAVGASSGVVLRAKVTAAPGTTVTNVAGGSVGRPGGRGVGAMRSSRPVVLHIPGNDLADTGATVWQGIRLALLLIVTGGLTLAVARRRRRT